MAVVDVVKKTYVNSQDRKYGVVVVVDNADRAAQFPIPLLYQRVQNLASGDIEQWNGATWITVFQGTGGVKVSWPSRAFGITGDSATNDYGSFNTLVNVTMQPNGGRVILTGIVRVGNNLTIPSNITIDYTEGARIAPDLGVTITHTGRVKALPIQIFGGGGRIKFDNNHTLKAIYAEWWGAIADCTGFGTGTDSTLGIQSATDAITLGGARCKLRLLGGGYRMEDTWHLGYGIAGFTGIIVDGQGSAYAGMPFPGTAIYPSKTDRPGANFQGGRNCRVRGVAVLGKLGAYITAQAFCTPGFLTDDTVAANWNDPAQGGAALDSRYAPFAAFTVDAYSGAQPGTHYPAVTYPAYLGVVPQYNKNFSSDCLIEDVYISGFTVAVANQPCDADGNGDFTRLNNVSIMQCKWGVSVGNTQSRNVGLSDIKFSSLYCLLTTNKHGRQNGKFGSPIHNVSGGSSIKYFEFGSNSIAGPLIFEALYGEAMWQIGSIIPSTSAENSIVFRQGLTSFDLQTDARGHPAKVLDSLGQPIDVFLDGFTLGGYKSVCQLQAIGLRIDGSQFFRQAAPANMYEKFANNALAGGLVTYQLATPARCRVKTLFMYNLDTGVDIGSGFTDIWKDSDRNSCIPFYCENVAALNGKGDKYPFHWRTAEGFAKATLAGLALAGSTLTITFAARSEYFFAQNGPLPGDVIWDDNTGTVFFVRSRIGNVVLAEIQNNYKVVGGVTTPLVAFSNVVGNFYWRNSRIYMPPYVLWGDTTAANAVINNVQRDDGFAAWFDAEILANDWMLHNGEDDVFIDAAGSQINARSQAAKTITMASAGMRATQVRRNLRYFVRQPPANV